MRRVLGSLALGSALLLAPVSLAVADDIEAEAAEMLQEEDGSNRNLILAALAALVIVGGAFALSRRK